MKKNAVLLLAGGAIGALVLWLRRKNAEVIGALAHSFCGPGSSFEIVNPDLVTVVYHNEQPFELPYVVGDLKIKAFANVQIDRVGTGSSISTTQPQGLQVIVDNGEILNVDKVSVTGGTFYTQKRTRPGQSQKLHAGLFRG